MKDSFIMQTKYEKHFRRLGEKRGYMLLMAIFEYEQTRIIPELDESIEDAFYFIKDDLDKAYENYQKAVDRNKANGSKGGRPKKPNGKTENPKNPVGFQKADNDSDSEYDISAVADISARETAPQKQQRAYIQFYSDNIGIITPSTVKEAESFIEDDGMEDAAIVMALKEAVDADAKNWRYAKKVLSSWLERGIKTAEQAKAAKTEFKNRKCRGKPKNVAERTYTAEEKKQREIDAFAEMERLWEEDDHA